MITDGDAAKPLQGIVADVVADPAFENFTTNPPSAAKAPGPRSTSSPPWPYQNHKYPDVPHDYGSRIYKFITTPTYEGVWSEGAMERLAIARITLDQHFADLDWVFKHLELLNIQSLLPEEIRKRAKRVVELREDLQQRPNDAALAVKLQRARAVLKLNYLHWMRIARWIERNACTHWQYTLEKLQSLEEHVLSVEKQIQVRSAEAMEAARQASMEI